MIAIFPVLAAPAGALSAGALTSGQAAVDAAIAPLAAQAAAHREPAEVWSDFRTGTYERFASEAGYRKALAAFLAGPSAGGGGTVARVYRAAGKLYVTFDPATHGSLDTAETAYYEDGKLARRHVKVTAYNGYYTIDETTYYGPSGTTAETAERHDFAPADTAFAHPLKTVSAKAGTVDAPVYPTVAKLPFKV